MPKWTNDGQENDHLHTPAFEATAVRLEDDGGGSEVARCIRDMYARGWRVVSTSISASKNRYDEVLITFERPLMKRQPGGRLI